MAGAVENKEVTRDRLGGDDVWILRHISGSVDLSFVIDPLGHADLALRASKAADL